MRPTHQTACGAEKKNKTNVRVRLFYCLLYSGGMQTVIVHSGNFHPDDVFAVATLQLHLGKENIEVIRTRDETVISKADWVADVGGVYDQDRRRFDHHQNGAPVRENGIPYAAFGLVWKHLGESICASKEVADSIEERIAQQIDAGDNGVSLYTLNEHNVSPYELYNVVGTFRPVWGSGTTDDEAFLQAVDFARELLVRTIAHARAGEKMKLLVQAGYEAAEDKKILVYDQSVGRNSFIEFDEVGVVVHPSESEEHKWKAVVIPKGCGTFENRVTFPAAWASLKDDELAQVSGIEDAVFCHKNLFLFVANTKEGALAAARQAK
jgi:uncharacterized UPF0160 family protein